MGFRRVFDIVAGLTVIAYGLFHKEFKPTGWTTWLVWGREENDRIPRWIAGSFNVPLGLFLLYLGITRK